MMEENFKENVKEAFKNVSECIASEERCTTAITSFKNVSTNVIEFSENKSTVIKESPESDLNALGETPVDLETAKAAVLSDLSVYDGSIQSNSGVKCPTETEAALIDIDEENCEESQTIPSYDVGFDFSKIPLQITGCWKEFSGDTKNNFTKGCKWAPDGSCILTCSDDNILRLFNLPPQIWEGAEWTDIQELEAVVKISEGECVYDYCWYPHMNSSDPPTCCLASCSRNTTVHLWDGFTGELRCSYRPYNHLDEVIAPHSLSFDASGEKLFCGFEKYIRIFNVDTPGRNFEERRIFANKSGQSGIISCLAFTPTNRNISVTGSYNKTIGIYSEPSGFLEHLLEGQKGGVTQVKFSPDGMLLYSGGRKDPEILCWDLRNLGTVLFSLRRVCKTNQRMQFDISRCGRYVASGNHNGVVTIWDITKDAHVVDFSDFDVLEPAQFYLAHNDCVNGISLHPHLPLLCSSSGQRHVPDLLPEEAAEVFSSRITKKDNSLRLWWAAKAAN